MELHTAALITVAGFLLILTGIGIWHARRIRTAEDFALAGRGFGAWGPRGHAHRHLDRHGVHLRQRGALVRRRPRFAPPSARRGSGDSRPGVHRAPRARVQRADRAGDSRPAFRARAAQIVGAIALISAVSHHRVVSVPRGCGDRAQTVSRRARVDAALRVRGVRDPLHSARGHVQCGVDGCVQWDRPVVRRSDRADHHARRGGSAIRSFPKTSSPRTRGSHFPGARARSTGSV